MVCGLAKKKNYTKETHMCLSSFFKNENVNMIKHLTFNLNISNYLQQIAEFLQLPHALRNNQLVKFNLLF